MRFINAADEKVLHIGKQGENLSTAVDFSGFRNACLAAFGEGTLTLAHERAEDEGPYLIPLEGAVWNVTAADVQFPGTGLAELTYRVGDVVKKTMRWKTCTLSALGAQVEPPEAWQGYIDRVTALVDGIENMTVSAFPADEPTVTKSTDSEGRVHLSFGIVAGKDGHTPVKGEDYTDGKDGVGVASAARSGDSLIITLTDGTTYTIPDVRGATGPQGPKGDKGDSVTGPQGPKGDKGDPGRDGITPVKGVDYFDGQPGTGIAGIVREGDSLIIILTDGTQYTIPNLRGATGPQGPKGEKGDKGDSITGPKGEKGDPGKDAEVTADNITAALGYTPADEAVTSDLTKTVDGISAVVETGALPFTVEWERKEYNASGEWVESTAYRSTKKYAISEVNGFTIHAAPNGAAFVYRWNADGTFDRYITANKGTSLTINYSEDLYSAVAFETTAAAYGNVTFDGATKKLVTAAEYASLSEKVDAKQDKLNYTPASAADAAFATAGAYTEPVSTEEYEVGIPDGAKYARVDMVGGHVEFIAGQEYIAAVESVVRHSENIFDKSKSIKTRLYPSSSDLSLKAATSGYSVAYKLEPNTTYSISKMPSSRGTFALAQDSFSGLVEDAEIIGFRSNITEHTFATDNNFTWLVWLVWNQTGDGVQLPYETILDSICLVKGDIVKYTPYYAEKHDIPESVRNLDGYGWSAGDVYNSIERTTNGWQYVKRVERVMMESPAGEFYRELAVPEVIDITAEMGSSLSPFALAKGDTITFDNTAEMYVPERISYAKGITEALDAKQDTLVSGQTIKTINGESLLGEGNIVVQGGGAEKEWVLKGVWTDGTQPVSLDLNGCTELFITGYIKATGNVDIYTGINRMVYTFGYNGTKHHRMLYGNQPIAGIMPLIAKWSTSEVIQGDNTSAYTVGSESSTLRISNITEIHLSNTSAVTEMNIKIYAR